MALCIDDLVLIDHKPSGSNQSDHKGTFDNNSAAIINKIAARKFFAKTHDQPMVCGNLKSGWQTFIAVKEPP